MTAMLLLMLVVMSVSIASSVDPCCFPEKGEGFADFVAEIGGKPIKVAGVVKFSIDYDARRVAVSERLYINGAVKRYQVIEDFKEKKLYVIYGERKCYVAPLPYDLQPRCILKNATFVSSTYLGVGPSALKTNTYAMNIRRGDVKVAAVIVITQDNCIPVSQVLKGTKEYKPFSEVLGVYNYTLGIKDPAVFVPPKFCGKMVSRRARTTWLPATTQRVLDFLTMPNEEH